MKLYLAGKIYGDQNYKSEFYKAAERLTTEGHIVLNTAWMPKGLSNVTYMRIAITILDIAEAAVFMPDWKENENARTERDYCHGTGKRILEWEDIKAIPQHCGCCAFYEDGRCCQPLGAELEEGRYINVSPYDYCSAWELGF